MSKVEAENDRNWRFPGRAVFPDSSKNGLSLRGSILVAPHRHSFASAHSLRSTYKESCCRVEHPELAHALKERVDLIFRGKLLACFSKEHLSFKRCSEIVAIWQVLADCKVAHEDLHASTPQNSFNYRLCLTLSCPAYPFPPRVRLEFLCYAQVLTIAPVQIAVLEILAGLHREWSLGLEHSCTDCRGGVTVHARAGDCKLGEQRATIQADVTKFVEQQMQGCGVTVA